ncbi:hypothetical protein [Paraburkholderia agricolaris]|uniref:hypothetical protein n=1 Tax=Paraburkholderia agricolaris TaxID=2152888 RepID=UPI0012916ECC|nr:hypothetical protein [Paraburkholderia agricolaris]
MTLPPFTPPTLDELRQWYRLHRENEVIWRLILEVQHGRQTLACLNTLLTQTARAARRAEFGRLTGEAAPLLNACSVAEAEMFRIGPIGGKGKFGTPPVLTGGAEGFDYDPDDPVDRAAWQAAMAHRKRR